MPEAAIFDYGVGNLLSLKCALEKVRLNAKITVSAQQLSKADAIALPGVGNFSAAVTKLDAVKEQLLTVVESGTPLLGICLGLQLFFQESDEGPGKGLALFEGKAVRLQGAVKVPHMGWNTLRIVKQIVAAETEYGTTFTSAIASKNVYGTQFHPEKSGDVGLKILENFAKIVRR
jgi:glutamine amidotransferase